MIPVTHARGQMLALFGLGGSGLATARALKAGGARVIACDDNASQMEKARSEGIETGDLREIDWTKASSLLLSPGVPLTHKDGYPFTHWTVALAREHRVEVIGDVELFCRERRAIAPDAPFVAITGTNGKSTTTALAAHLLRAGGFDAQTGGNIGAAVLSLEPFANDRFYVIECSSFQIDLAPSLDPTVGVLLNVTPDHLDRHGAMENYAAIKQRLVMQAARAVVNIDDPYAAEAAAQRRTRGLSTMRMSMAREAEPASGIIVAHDGRLQIAIPNGVSEISIAGVTTLRGAHNVENALAAFGAVIEACPDREPMAFAKNFRSFAGLPHRLEEVGRIGPVLFVNDSKATNADSTDKALASFGPGIHWILGGKSKEGGIAPLKPHFGKIAKAYLVGAATEEFAATLDGQAPYEKCGAIDVAVAHAARDASAAHAARVVLLSPACASYDQFPNFEVRGDHFKRLVAALPGFEPKAIQS